MFVDLTDVLRGPGQRIEKPIDIPPGKLDDIELAEAVVGVIRVQHARQNIVVGGKAKTVMVVPCSRCLQLFNQSLDLEFEAIAPIRFFRAAGFGSSGSGTPYPTEHLPPHPSTIEGEVESEEPDDELVAVFEGYSLDALELVRQAIELQAPIQPLCSPDCPGLPEAAEYSVGPEDGRWSALQNWKNGVGHAQESGS